jgi:hypothetical protein
MLFVVVEEGGHREVTLVCSSLLCTLFVPKTFLKLFLNIEGANVKCLWV